MSGLFDTFTIAKRGLTVQQGNINTSSHNIANASTEGYSRQRAVAETTRPFGGMSRFDTSGVGQIGTGAEITSIQRIRDYFIDYQVRSETGTSGFVTQASQTLSKVEDVLGEPSDKGIQQLINQFFSSFQELSKSPDKSDIRTVAIQKASSLADAINYAYNQMKKTNEDTQKDLQNNVKEVNSYLEQINELNKQIRGVSAVGQAPNDLMDKRDLLLDKLSNDFGIKVDRDTFETISLSSTEYPNSYLVKSDPNDTGYSRMSYIKSATANHTSAIPPVYDGTVTVEYYPLGNENAATKTFTLTADGATLADKVKNAKSLSDELMQNRILIGDKDGYVGTSVTSAPTATVAADVAGLVTDPTTGVITVTKIAGGQTTKTTITPPTTTLELKKEEFQTYKYETYSGTAVNNVDNKHVKGKIAANQSTQDNIKGYMDDLDRLAAALAYSVNAIQTGSVDGTNTSNGLSNDLVFVTYDEINKVNKTTDTGITAENIRVNGDLLKDSGKLNCNTTSSTGKGDGLRAKAIANLNVVKMNISNVASTDELSTMTRKDFLEKIGVNTTATTSGFTDLECLNLNAGIDGSTVDSYYKTIVNNLAVMNDEADRIAGNQKTILANLEDQKSEVSGVSLDEEMTSLIQFQHAYQANAKMISTIDELLDVVINGLKK